MGLDRQTRRVHTGEMRAFFLDCDTQCCRAKIQIDLPAIRDEAIEHIHLTRAAKAKGWRLLHIFGGAKKTVVVCPRCAERAARKKEAI